ncbi:unnamed protein product [Effrenium voratum]|nr:unnamed protein product [Effrenium voratum]
MSCAWESELVPCKRCVHCCFRAERNKDTCCGKCSPDNACELEGHEAHCSRLTEQALRSSYWEKVRCDSAAEQEADCLVVPNRAGEGPRPVILFLTGNGHVDDRQDFFGGGIDQLMRNNELKSYILLAPKPLSKTGVLRYNDQWRWNWCEDGLWAMLTEILRRLGPSKVDPSQLYATGLSLGAAGVWHLALKYGQYLAGVAPISGVCQWPYESWPRRSGPKREVLERLSELPMRAYQIDVDRYSGTPTHDIEWLCYGLQEVKEELNLRGMELDRRVDVAVRRWCREGGKPWELWEAKGPLKDWAYYDQWGGDKHCLWNRVYPWPEWGLASFFAAHRLPQEKCWDIAVASPLSDVLAQQKKDEEAYYLQKAEEEAKAMDVDAPMEATVGKMSAGDMEVMQEQKRLRQDDTEMHAVPA